MDEIKIVFPERFSACKNHPEKREIFLLEQLLIAEGVPYRFNFWDDLRGVMGEPDGDPDTDIDWDAYNFLIEAGEPVAPGLSLLSVCLDRNDSSKLEVLDMRGAGDGAAATDGVLQSGLSAQQAAKILSQLPY